MFLLGSSFNFQTILIIMIFVIAFTLISNLYKSIQKKKQLTITKPIMKTQLRCEKCEGKIIRAHNKTDVIFSKSDEKCKNDDKNMIIEGIFTDPNEKPKKSGKKSGKKPDEKPDEKPKKSDKKPQISF